MKKVMVFRSLAISVFVLALAACQQPPKPAPRQLEPSYQFHTNSPVKKETYDITEQPQFVPYACAPTPRIEMEFPAVEKVNKTNNLWRKAGSAEPAYGRPVYIRGIVTDKACVPLQNATVEIWQADSNGVYTNLGGSAGDFMEKTGKKADKYFMGTGTAYTNNMGEFSFITIFPGPMGNSIPHLKVRVKHPDFKSLTTKMYFEDIVNNLDDPDFEALDPKQRKRATAVTDPTGVNPKKKATTYYYNISLTKKAAYRGY